MKMADNNGFLVRYRLTKRSDFVEEKHTDQQKALDRIMLIARALSPYEVALSAIEIPRFHKLAEARASGALIEDEFGCIARYNFLLATCSPELVKKGAMIVSPSRDFSALTGKTATTIIIDDPV